MQNRSPFKKGSCVRKTRRRSRRSNKSSRRSTVSRRRGALHSCLAHKTDVAEWRVGLYSVKGQRGRFCVCVVLLMRYLGMNWGPGHPRE